ncbi:GAF domain-containing protein [Stenotrophomonas sp.]|uniref:GAF domain-containing protein n=1 Tax=Stenotrophomonas sp. TaxID=69392 RepID=UPI00374C9595
MTTLTTEDHLALCNALADAARPTDVYQAVERVLAGRPGFGLFTMLVRTPDGEQVRRVHTNNPQAYPLEGCKRMGPTPWGDLVLERRQCYLAHDAEGIRWAFPDHALIASLGLASAINVPVVALGQVLGTINLLGAAGRYQEGDVAVVRSVAAYLAVPFLREVQGDVAAASAR